MFPESNSYHSNRIVGYYTQFIHNPCDCNWFIKSWFENALRCRHGWQWEIPGMNGGLAMVKFELNGGLFTVMFDCRRVQCEEDPKHCGLYKRFLQEFKYSWRIMSISQTPNSRHFCKRFWPPLKRLTRGILVLLTHAGSTPQETLRFMVFHG